MFWKPLTMPPEKTVIPPPPDGLMSSAVVPEWTVAHLPSVAGKTRPLKVLDANSTGKM